MLFRSRGRGFLWSTGRELLLENPTFGIGYLAIETVKEPLILQASHASSGGGFHSLVIDSWLGSGLAGPISVVGLVVIATYRLGKLSTKGRDWARNATWTIPFVYGLLRASTESSGWLIDKNVNVLTAVLWVCVGASLSGRKSQTSAEIGRAHV